MFKSNKDFTLVELIVVIAILAILAGVAVPAYSGYITKANDAAVITELDAIKTAAQAANATSGEISKIEVTSAGAITVTATTLSTNFNSDFITFFGDGTSGANAGTITGIDIDFDGTSYEDKNATWENNKWTATTPPTEP